MQKKRPRHESGQQAVSGQAAQGRVPGGPAAGTDMDGAAPGGRAQGAAHDPCPTVRGARPAHRGGVAARTAQDVGSGGSARRAAGTGPSTAGASGAPGADGTIAASPGAETGDAVDTRPGADAAAQAGAGGDEPGAADEDPAPAPAGTTGRQKSSKPAPSGRAAPTPASGNAGAPEDTLGEQPDGSAAVRTGPDAPPRRAGSSPQVGRGRRRRVRSRLVVAVAVVAAAVAGAAAPGLLAASGRVGDAQALADEAERTQQALSLAHLLADERDDLTAVRAAGRPYDRKAAARHRVPVDRQLAELRADAPAALRRTLDRVAAVRAAALNGEREALAIHRSYAEVILGLHRLAEHLARHTPPEAAPGAPALADLDTAVQQAEATRGLLLAALAVPGSTATVIDPVTGLPRPAEPPSATRRRDGLSAAAQEARFHERAALTAFRDRAPVGYRSAYDSTVTGPQVAAAERDLEKLTDRRTLSADDRETDARKLAARLTARIDLMRGAEAALTAERTKDAARLRDDAVTALEIAVAIAGGCLLLAVGIAMATARGLTRPLAVLRIGTDRLAADPHTAEPIRFTGRNDEFAQVIRSVNALHAQVAEAAEQLRGTGRPHGSTADPTDRDTAPDGTPPKGAAALDAVPQKAATGPAAAGEDAPGVGDGPGRQSLVDLARRTLGLVERQLAVIEKAEEQEHDPDRLATLFELDHFATVMRRHSENLLVLAGAKRGHQQSGPVPLIDVVRAAVSEIEHYERVHVEAVPGHVHVTGPAADDLSHLLAELMENATCSSPPDVGVEVSGWLVDSGDVTLSVADDGVGMAPERLAEVNERLAAEVSDGGDPVPAGAPDTDTGRSAGLSADLGDAAGAAETGAEDRPAVLGLGLYVVARLARRHGVRVQLVAQMRGGIAAVVVLPRAVLAAVDADAVAPPRAVRVVDDPAADDPKADDPSAGVHAPVRPGQDLADSLIEAAESALHGTPPSADTPRRATRPRHRRPDARPVDESGVGQHGHAADVRHDPPPPDGGHRLPTAADQRPTNPYAISADSHGRAPDAAASGEPAGPGASGAEPSHAAAPYRLTDKGLPKRTPRSTQPAGGPRPRVGAVDAQELRRRLAGFQQGARQGWRDAQAEHTSDRHAVVADTAPPDTESAADTANVAARQPAPKSAARTAPAPHPGTARTATATGWQDAHEDPNRAARPPADVKGDTVEEASS